MKTATGLILVTGLTLLPGCREQSGITIQPLDSPADTTLQAADPAVAGVPGGGDLVLSWVEGAGEIWSLLMARLPGGSDRWSVPVRVAGGPDAPEEVHLHAESSPRLVVVSDDRMALVWPNNIKVPGRRWPAAMLRFARSEDGGRSWTRPITLNDDTTGALVSHQFHGATLVGDSGLAVAWLDERHVAAPIATGSDGHGDHAVEPDATIYMTRSGNFGGTWSPNQRVGQAACPCCRVSLARAPDGRAIAAWRKHFPGNVRDVVTSELAGEAAEPVRVYPDEWSYPGCPHSGPALAITSDGARHVVWYNGKPGDTGVYYTRWSHTRVQPVRIPLVTGQKVSTAHPTVAALPNGGALAAWDITAKGERRISVARLAADGSVVDKTDVPGSLEGTYPRLAVMDDRTAVLAWTRTTQDASQLRLARLRLE